MRTRWELAATRWATSVLIAWLCLTGSASATLIDRGASFVYDDVLDITWTRNANLPGSSGLSWAKANAWAAGLTYGGFNDWRLPTINLPSPTNNATDCNTATATACAASGTYQFAAAHGGHAGAGLEPAATYFSRESLTLFVDRLCHW